MQNWRLHQRLQNLSQHCSEFLHFFIACLPNLEAIYATQEQRTFIQRQGENPREDEVSIDASHMALVAMASSAAALDYGVFSCKVGRIQAHCQEKNNRFKPFFLNENQRPEFQRK